MSSKRTVTPENDLNRATATCPPDQGGAMLSLNIRVDEARAHVHLSVPVPGDLAVHHMRGWIQDNIHNILSEMDEIKSKELGLTQDKQHGHVIEDIRLDDQQNFLVNLQVKPEVPNIDIAQRKVEPEDEGDCPLNGTVGSEDTATSGMDTPRSSSSESGELCDVDLPAATPSSLVVTGKDVQVKFRFPKTPNPPRSARGPRKRRSSSNIHNNRLTRERLSYPTEETMMYTESLTEAQQAMDLDQHQFSSAADSGMLTASLQHTSLSEDKVREAQQAKQNIIESLRVLEEANSQLSEAYNHLCDRNESLSVELEDVRLINKDLQCQLNSKDEMMARVIEENEEYKIKRDELEKEVMRLQGQVTSTWEGKTKFEDMYIRLKAKMNDIEKENEEYKKNLDKKSCEVAYLRKKVGGDGVEWMVQIQNLKDEVLRFKSEKIVEERESEKLKRQLDNLKTVANDLQQKYDEEKNKHSVLIKSFNDIKEANSNLKLRTKYRRNSIGNGLPMKSVEGITSAGPPKPTTPPKVLPDMLTRVPLSPHNFKAKFDQSKSMTETFPPLTRRK